MKGAKIMSIKEEYTVEYLMKLLNCCASDAVINIITVVNGVKTALPITSLLIHQTEDKRELISFLHDQEDLINDL